MLRAQEDDFAVRRFYVVFKGSQADAEARRAILSTFSSRVGTQVERLSSAKDDLTVEQLGVVEKVLTTIINKLK